MTLRSSLIDHLDDVADRGLVDGEADGIDGFGRQRLPLRLRRHADGFRHGAASCERNRLHYSSLLEGVKLRRTIRSSRTDSATPNSAPRAQDRIGSWHLGVRLGSGSSELRVRFASRESRIWQLAEVHSARMTDRNLHLTRAADGMALERVAEVAARLERELAKAIVGQQRVIREILIAFLAGGHCLLRGVPGLAKTLLIKKLAEAVDLKFNRIQFTPDLMPSDILGAEVIEEDRRRRQARHPVHPRADLREHHPRRRDQPHAAEDAGGAARGDAGIPGHGQRRAVRSRTPAVRARHAEPDRAGRHLSAAGGAARSVHVQRRDRLSDRRTKSGASWR